MTSTPIMEPNESSEPTDWELAHRAKSGDEAAYAMLISRHQAAIHNFIFRSAGDVETARELTQEVFVKAWFALRRVREQARFTTWLFQIAVNLCRDHAKSRSSRNARRTESISRDDRDNRSEDREFASTSATPDREALQREFLAALEAEIQALPAELRSAFILGVVEHRSHKEVATILRLTAKAVEVRIYRARRLLGERLKRLGIEHGAQ
jgi:RNA polymerase sigma factor (sigma-70 family)